MNNRRFNKVFSAQVNVKGFQILFAIIFLVSLVGVRPLQPAQASDDFNPTGSNIFGNGSSRPTFTCDTPVRIMPLGDSITSGNASGVDTLGDTYKISYRKDLWDMLKAGGHHVDFVGGLTHGNAYPGFDADHEGHGGKTDDFIASNIISYLNANPADIILLHIGTNGLNSSPNDVEAILDNIDSWEAANNHITVVLARIINRNSYNQTTTDFNDNVEAMALARTDDDIIIVDMEDGAGINYATYTNHGDMWDNIHPYASGYEKMAKVWFDAIQPLLPVCAPVPTCPADMGSYWQLDETSSGSYADVYGINIGLCSGTDCPTPTISGIINGAQDFSRAGLTKVNVLKDMAFDWGVDDSFSIEYWIKGVPGVTCSGSATSDNHVVIGRQGSGTTGDKLHLWTGCSASAGGKAVFQLRDRNGNGDSITGTTNIADGSWHHIVAIRDASANKNYLYVNGVKEGELSHIYTAGFTSPTAQLNLGWLNLNPFYHFTGTLDEVAIYDRALSPTEIIVHYNSGSGATYCTFGSLAPIITSSPVTTAEVSVAYAYDVNASGSPAPTYSLTTAPAGMTINATTGLIEWTPAEAGVFDVVVVATNSEGTDTQPFSITVTTPSACPADMVAYWKLDETSGSTFEDYFNDHHAGCSAGNCPSFGTGILNGALSFNGTNQWITVPDHDDFDWGEDDSFTVELWANLTNCNTRNKVMIGRDNSPSGTHWWMGCDVSSKKARVNLLDTTRNGTSLAGTTSINDGNWHHIVLVRDKSNDQIRLYVNAVMEDSKTHVYAAGFEAPTSLGIGYMAFSGTPDYFYDGLLDEIAIYNRALTHAEITDHYNDGVGKSYCTILTNEAPEITSTPVTSAHVDVPYTYHVVASGSPAPTFALTTAPGGMTINETTGLIEWTPTTAGDVDVTVTATNSEGFDLQSFTIQVTGPPEPPLVENVILSSSPAGGGLVSDDLLCGFDLSGSDATSATAWYVDGSPQMTLYLPMEGGATNALLDYSGSNKHVNEKGTGAVWGETSGFGGSGGFSFDHTANAYLEISEAMPGGSYTKTAWVYANQINDCHNIISGDQSNAFWVTNSRLQAGHNGGWTNHVRDSVNFPLDEWIFVAVTFDGSQMILYKNGNPVASNNSVPVHSCPSCADPALLQIGAFINTPSSPDRHCTWNGKIDDARVYGFSLSPQQIATLYNAGTGDVNTIVSQETSVGDTWQCQVTPFSASEAGTLVASNPLEIISSTPTCHTLTLSHTGSGTDPAADPTHSTGCDAGQYTAGQTINLSGAVPDTGWQISGWTGTSNDSSTADTNSLSMPDSDHAASVIYSEISSCPVGMTSNFYLDEPASPYIDAMRGLQATCTNCPSSVPGLVGNALQFSSPNRVTIEPEASINWKKDDSFSIEFWLWKDVIDSNIQVGVGRQGTGGNPHHMWIGVWGNKANFTLKNAGSDNHLNSSNTLLAQHWNHIVAVRDNTAGTNTIYLNGVATSAPVAYPSDAYFQNDAIPLDIGWINNSPYYYLVGKLDQLSFYNRALTPSEVQAHYANPLLVSSCTISPTIYSSPVLTANVGEPYQYLVQASGIPAPTFALTSAPVGMTIDPNTGLIEWTPTTAGDVDVTVTATNSEGFDLQSFTIQVTGPPEPPLVENVILSSSPAGGGLVSDDLLCGFDLSGSAATSATAWYVDGSPQMTLYLPMEGGATNALLDLSGSDNHATAVGSPSWSAAGGFDGKGAFEFSGNNHLNAGAAMPTNAAYTKAAWVYWIPGNDMNNILSGQSGHAFWVTNYPESAGFYLSAGHQDPWRGVKDTQVFTSNTWIHVAVTYDPANTTMVLYRDGQVVATSTSIAPHSDAQAFIGAFASSYRFKGFLDDVRIYAHALSPQQISTLYNVSTRDGNTIVSQETSVGDTWQCQVTPFSASEAGTLVASNPLEIISSTPTCHTLTLSHTGSGAVPAADPTHSTGCDAGQYTAGQTINLSGAVPDTGWQISGWSGTSNDGSTDSTNSLTMPDSDHAASVIYTEIPSCPAAMIAYYPLDEASGSVFSDVFGGNDGVCSGTGCPAPVTGIVGNAQSFDGVNDNISAPDTNTMEWTADSSFTIELWAKINPTDNCSGNKVMVGRDGPGNLHWWVGCHATGNVAHFGLRDNGGTYRGTLGTTAINDGEWHHIVAVRDKSSDQNRIYVDGVLQNTVTYDYSNGFSGNAPLSIGSLNAGYWFKGQLDEVAVYNRALSDIEILTHYNQGDGIGYCEEVAPSIVSTPVTSAQVGVPYTYNVIATGNPLPAFALTTAPVGMTIDPNTGLIEWTPATAGDIEVTVTATNSEGSDTQDFTITVSEASLCPVGMTYYWELEENGPPFVDSAGSQDATCTNCPSQAAGILGFGQEFNGTSHEVDVTAHDSFNWDADESFTVEFWVWKNTACTGNEVMVGRQGTGGTNQLHMWIGCLANGNAYFQLKDNDNKGGGIENTIPLNDGDWHHVVAVRDASAGEKGTNYLYVDSIPVSISTYTYHATAGFGSTSNLNIGYLNLSGKYRFDGILDEIAVYGRALTSDEISANYNKGAAIKHCQACNLLTLEHTGQGSDPEAAPLNSTGCPLAQFKFGQVIDLSGAVPDTGWQISGWTGTSNDSSTDSTNSLTMPDSDHAASVIYSQITHALSVSKVGQGTVTSDPVGIDCGGTCAADFNHGTSVTLTAEPADGWAFSGWSGDCTGMTCQVTMDQARAVTATFEESEPSSCPLDLIAYWELDEPNPSTSFADSTGSHPASCSGAECPVPTSQGILGYGQDFTRGTTKLSVPYSADFDWGPTDSFTIEYWMKGTTGTCTTGNEIIVGREGTGNSMRIWTGCRQSCSPVGKCASFQLQAINGTNKTLNGISNIADGDWHHIVAVRDGSTNSNYLYVDGVLENDDTQSYPENSFTSPGDDLTIGWLNLSGEWGYKGTLDEVAIYSRALTSDEISANYNKGAAIKHCQACNLLTLEHTGQGSDPEAAPLNSTSCPLDQYKFGQVIDLSGAVPDTGWQISGWSGTSNDGSTDSTNSLTMPDSDHAASVIYSQVTHALSVSKVGQGTVTSDPVGIDCGGTCAADFNHGTSVTLTSEPADGWAFSGWSGDCTGMTCQVTMSQARNVTATFAILLAEHDISLVEGWNLVSFNLIPSSTAIEDVLFTIAGKYNLVYAWDAENELWQLHDPDVGYGSGLTNLNEKQGFWIMMNEAATLTVSGTLPTSTEIPMFSGWNLVGYPSVSNRSLSGALTAHGIPAGDLSMVVAYMANDQADPWKLYDPAAPGYANDLPEMLPGWGYWVKLASPGTWTLPFIYEP